MARSEMRLPGVEPGAQAWEACMLPLHYLATGRLPPQDTRAPGIFCARPCAKLVLAAAAAEGRLLMGSRVKMFPAGLEPATYGS